MPDAWKGHQAKGASHLSDAQAKKLVQSQAAAAADTSGDQGGAAAGGGGGGRRNNRHQASMGKDAAEDARLLQEAKHKAQTDPALKGMLKRRAELPAWKARRELLELIDANQV